MSTISNIQQNSKTRQPYPDGTIPIDNWRDGLLRDGQFELHVSSCTYNAIHALAHAPEWAGVLGFDVNSSETVLKRPIPGPWSSDVHWPEFPCPWQDFYTTLASVWLQSEHIMVGKDLAWEAINVVGRRQPFHPIHEYLSNLSWDGSGRLDTWLSVYLGVEPSVYSQAVGSRFLISGVARVFHPGSKVDTCTILEGEQGKLKSTALEILAVRPAWFTDEIPALSTKDAEIQLRGIWIVEFSEFEALHGVAWNRIKAFLSRRVDRYRPVYGKHPVDFPRQNIFTASVNQFQYLGDETGARRFWPLATGHIDIDELRDDRDQLWAEAVYRFRAGASWWLDDTDLVSAAQAEQEDRYEGDVWQDLIARYLEACHPHNPACRVTMPAILSHIGIKPAEWDRACKIRVGQCLRALGWRRRREGYGDRNYFYVPS